MRYLIGYDITESKRLQKVYKRLCKYATPLQYSLFLFEGKYSELQACLKMVLGIFDKAEDDLRVYPLQADIKQWQLGREILPEGIIWAALPLFEQGGNAV